MELVCSNCGRNIFYGELCKCGKIKSEFNNGIWHLGNKFFMDHNYTLEKEKRVIAQGIDPWAKDLYIQNKFLDDYILPLIKKLEKDGKKINTILSAGCGTGVEVEILRRIGYDAYGYDPGSRHAAWNARKNCEGRLIHCFDDALPFKKESFDFISSQQVIEHIGVVGDSITPQKNCEKIRFDFCQNLIKYVKPGGALQIATPNRHFILDPGHAPNLGRYRLHSPFDRFLVTYDNMKSYFYPHKVKALTPVGYYSGTSFSNNKFGRLFNKYLNLINRFEFLLSSPLNPLCSVLVTKNS